MSDINPINNTYETVNGYRSSNDATASPAAQTFMSPSNSYLSAVNLYFNYKGYQNRPVVMEIRNTNSNGSPGDVVYGETSVSYSNINVNDATEFKFPDPVLLLAGHRYAIVLYTSSSDYQLEVSVRNHLVNNEDPRTASQNPNGRVKGALWYSINGIDWLLGDPSGQLDANAGGICLKFDVKKAQFQRDQEIDFNDIYPARYHYNYLAKNSNSTYSNAGVNDTMSSISYLTFDPNELTPFSTSIDWQYSLDNGENWQTLPLNYTIPVQIRDSIKLRAFLHGSQDISPQIEKNSLHFAVQRTVEDSDNEDNKDEENNVGINQFDSAINDQLNSGEYISRTVVFSHPHASDVNKFNQVYASFEERNDAHLPTDLYINLNPDSNPDNNFRNKWIQMTGYDEYSYTMKNGNQHTTYMIVDPRTGTAYGLDPTDDNANRARKGPIQDPGDYTSHEYSEPVENIEQENAGESTWTRYHFHVSLNRLFKDKANLYPHENDSTVDDEPKGNEVKFKLIFHASSQYDHPMVRKFQTTVNKDNEQQVGNSSLN